jgi:hypothetical protein
MEDQISPGVLVGLLLVSLLMAAITVILTQLLRLAGGGDGWIPIILGIILALGISLVFPMIIAFAYLVHLLEWLVGTQCPSCRQRELEWQSGSWKYGDPPEYQYFACASCGAKFRQLCGGHGVLSGWERVERQSELA